MGITKATRISDLLDSYPFLLDYLLAQSPRFAKLKNPVLRRTLGRLATLETAAQLGGLEVDALVDGINEAIRRQGVAPAAPPPDTAARQQELKAIIRELHAGGDRTALKERFRTFLGQVSPVEIAEMEQALIGDGLPQQEIKQLSSLHVEIFRESLDDQPPPAVPAGHPVATYMAENRELEGYLDELETLVERAGRHPVADYFRWFASHFERLVEDLAAFERHYLRKENQLFPFLEQHGLAGPAQVMWALHDDVRALLKRARDPQGPVADRLAAVERLLTDMRDMIYKEERILLPLALEVLEEADWTAIRTGEDEIGYAWVQPGNDWRPAATASVTEAAATAGIPLNVGTLSAEMIDLMLTHLPVDLTLVDADDRVAYFSQGKERIFPRSPGIIGREVRNCHPPKSVHVVEEILARFKSGERDEAEFWLELGGRFLHIRYFALRDGAGSYRGCLEVSQDVTGIRALSGQRRLLEWE